MIIMNPYLCDKMLKSTKHLSPKAKAVFRFLCMLTSTRETGKCNPYNKTISDYTGLSRSQLKRAKNELMRAGLLRSKANYNRNKMQTYNIYTVTTDIADIEEIARANQQILEGRKKEWLAVMERAVERKIAAAVIAAKKCIEPSWRKIIKTLPAESRQRVIKNAIFLLKKLNLPQGRIGPPIKLH
jgi:hypothetical protein